LEAEQDLVLRKAWGAERGGFDPRREYDDRIREKRE